MRKNSVKEDDLDRMARLAFETCGDPDIMTYDSIDVSDVVFDGDFDARKAGVVSRYKKIIAARRSKVIIRLFAALLAALVIASVTVWALRSDDTVQEVKPTVKFENGSTLVIGFEHGSDNLPKKVETIVFPNYTPTGVSIERSNISDEEILVRYSSSSGDQYYVYRQNTLENDAVIKVESPVISETTINGYAGKIIIEKGTYNIYLLWSDGYYRYALEAFGFEVKELLEIARSVPC